MALAPERAIEAALAAGQRAALVRRAEARTPLGLSCRARDTRRLARRGAAVAAAAAACAAFAPGVLLAALTVWAVVTLVAATALKAAALWAVARRAPPGAPVLRFPGPAARLPAISVLVPLYGEAGIVPRLVARLSRLDYPRELTDVILVAEESDSVTRAALSATPLPGWMRVIVVPEGRVRTKPRALNYALDFARGSIVGVWDAEDAPDAGQLHAVARAFGEAPPDVVCLQGALDFYNARTNWLSRCFAIEYAGWFRVILPGLVRMGLVIPLGGTTLFFRRAALEELGGWDAHNVTEDADLGLRLARRGWRAGVLDSVTGEEPNARAWPWIRQRSRWLKGYAMTWGVHMRDPVRLWRDLGARRFIAVQILFAATLSQYLLAPFLWAWWGLTLGGAAPAAGQVTQGAMIALTALFVAAEGVNLAVGALGVRRAGHAGLMRWVPTLMFYFPLGAAAAFKALWEVAARPFWWDKTDHGVFDGGMEAGGTEGGGAGPTAAEDGPPRLAHDARRAPETPRAVRPARPPFSRRPAPRGAWPPHRA
jgi:cellulose synthase/poly-beta-1,6-N-acetylglucosamine synthase-like glycosyltransferase